MNACTVGIQAGQHRVATGAAQRECAVGVPEQDGPLCQAVDIGRVNSGGPVAAQHGIQIIGDHEQDVFGCRLLCRNVLRQQRQQAARKKSEPMRTVIFFHDFLAAG